MTRRTTSCNDHSNFMCHHVRNIASEWEHLCASEQVLGWIRRVVCITFIGGRHPHPFNNGIFMLGATHHHLDLMISELQRLMQASEWGHGKRSM
jgi:hypothetical protein